jgi:small subunit ribosomal protein S8
MTKSLNSMFSLINNASFSNQGEINIKTTKKCLKVLQLLYREGLIRGYTYNKYRTTIYIKFTGSTTKPVIKAIISISTNGRIIYANTKVLSKLINANELFLVSTSKGILTLKEALQYNVGGILFCKII